MAKGSIPWLRLLAEGVVIVASIMVALFADAWWDERQERVVEREALESLAVEVRSNLDVLAEKAEGHVRSEQAAVRLMRIVDGVVPLHEEPIDSLLWSVFLDAATFEARTGVLDGLVASGQLGVIQNAELRARLASWRAQLDDTSEEEAWIVNDIQTMWRPYLVRRALVRPAERVYGFFRDIGPGTRAYDFVGMFADSEFEGLVLLRLEDERLTLDAYEDLVTATQSILDLIEAELASASLD